MKLLILGGTLFLGRALVDAALARGHEVTLFNRGRTGQAPMPGVETLLGDRDGQLDALRGGSWDAVVDTSGYVPRLVRASAELLAGSVGRYVFVSTVSVYEDQGSASDEDSPLATMKDETVEEVTGETYGPLKVLCERGAEEIFGARALIIRPGLIVGPHDPTVRFSYWTERVARGGEVLAPAGPGKQIEYIDVRDLAEWMVRMIEGEQAGVLNAAGPDPRLTFGDFLETCRAAAGSDARFTWVSEEFLAEQGVAPWTELPLWIPGPRQPTSIARALAAGLSFRPLADTVRDTLAWQRGRAGQKLPEKAGVPMPDVTLKPERERRVLDAWHSRAP